MRSCSATTSTMKERTAVQPATESEEAVRRGVQERGLSPTGRSRKRAGGAGARSRAIVRDKDEPIRDAQGGLMPMWRNEQTGDPRRQTGQCSQRMQASSGGRNVEEGKSGESMSATRQILIRRREGRRRLSNNGEQPEYNGHEEESVGCMRAHGVHADLHASTAGVRQPGPCPGTSSPDHEALALATDRRHTSREHV